MHQLLRYTLSNYTALAYKLAGRPELRHMPWGAVLRATNLARRIMHDVIGQNACRRDVRTAVCGDGMVTVTVRDREVRYPAGADASVIGRTYYEIFDPGSGHFYDLACTAPRAGDVVWDVGTCEGLYGVKHIDTVDEVHMFEPSRLMCACLAQTFGRCKPGTWTVHNTILSDTAGKPVGFIENTGDPTCSAFAQPGETGSYILHTQTVDALVAAGTAAPTLIKMDVQGAELSILKGAVRTLHECRPRMAVTTYHNPMDATEIIEFVRSVQPAYRFTLKGITTVDPVPRPTMVHCY